MLAAWKYFENNIIYSALKIGDIKRAFNFWLFFSTIDAQKGLFLFSYNNTAWMHDKVYFPKLHAAAM